MCGVLAAAGVRRAAPPLACLRRRLRHRPRPPPACGGGAAAYLLRPGTAAPGYRPRYGRRLRRLRPRRRPGPAAEGLRASFTADLAARGQAKSWPPPRNGPCWCESGRKYKKCHGTPALT
ncbi:SEC-C domain-containing protein [Streptomyces sp. ISL-96]|uniref:SEC-C metal-binding domain-containing protein n=1 Tax=Streptomyces sp. ISL-96 TaxID=2819191 RepID=UPI001BEBD1A4|nr:SEC-C domain-containing protein [Streptomyces sp. ISL-96]